MAMARTGASKAEASELAALNLLDVVINRRAADGCPDVDIDLKHRHLRVTRTVQVLALLPVRASRAVPPLCAATVSLSVAPSAVCEE